MYALSRGGPRRPFDRGKSLAPSMTMRRYLCCLSLSVRRGSNELISIATFFWIVAASTRARWWVKVSRIVERAMLVGMWLS